MAGGIKLLRKMQIGIEDTPGQVVAATMMWRGIGRLKDNRVREVMEEEIGQFFRKPQTHLASLGAIIDMPEQTALFEQMALIGACGIKDVIAGVPDGEGTGLIYAYPQPLDTANTIKSSSIRGGDNQTVEVAEYCFVEKFSLKGAPGQAWKLAATWQGRQAAASTWTGALTPADAESMLFNKSKLYLDDAGGTIGSTQVTATWMAGLLNWITGWQALTTGDGDLFFTIPEFLLPEISGEFTFRHNTTGAAERAKAQAGDVRLMKLLIEGSALATPGTYSKKSVVLEAAIQYDAVPENADSNGRSTLALPWHAVDSDSIVPTLTVVTERANADR
jgi:hypothetical protein